MVSQNKGRPRKVGPPTELERERGRRIAGWIREGMTPPHQQVELSYADVARLTGISKSSVSNYLNDCYDANEDRMKYPSEENIQKLAVGLRIDRQRGHDARWWMPSPSTKTPATNSRRIAVPLPDGQTVEIIVPSSISDIELDRIRFAVRLALAEQQ